MEAFLTDDLGCDFEDLLFIHIYRPVGSYSIANIQSKVKWEEKLHPCIPWFFPDGNLHFDHFLVSKTSPAGKSCAIIFSMAENETQEIATGTLTAEQRKQLARQRWILVGVIALIVALIAGIVLAVIGLLQDRTTTANIRDIFIIFLALESLIIGAALVILVIQIAGLINLLQNEIRPILEATNETVNTLRGTTSFLSENLVEPVIKMNSYLAGLRRFFEIFGIKQK